MAMKFLASVGAFALLLASAAQPAAAMSVLPMPSNADGGARFADPDENNGVFAARDADAPSLTRESRAFSRLSLSREIASSSHIAYEVLSEKDLAPRAPVMCLDCVLPGEADGRKSAPVR